MQFTHYVKNDNCTDRLTVFENTSIMNNNMYAKGKIHNNINCIDIDWNEFELSDIGLHFCLRSAQIYRVALDDRYFLL